MLAPFVLLAGALAGFAVLGLFAEGEGGVDSYNLLVFAIPALLVVLVARSNLRHFVQRAHTLWALRGGELSLDATGLYAGPRRAFARTEMRGVGMFAYDTTALLRLRVARDGQSIRDHVWQTPRAVAEAFVTALGVDPLHPAPLRLGVTYSARSPHEGPTAARLRGKLKRHRVALVVGVWLPLFCLTIALGPVAALLFCGATALVALDIVRTERAPQQGFVTVTEAGAMFLGDARSPDAVLHLPWAQIHRIEHDAHGVVLTLLDDTHTRIETMSLHPTQPSSAWHLAALLQTHRAAWQARLRGPALDAMLAQGGRSPVRWCEALVELARETPGYRASPRVAPASLWLMALDDTADLALRVAALVALAGGDHLSAHPLLWNLAHLDPTLHAVVAEVLGARPFSRVIAMSCLAAVSDPTPPVTGVRLAPEAAAPQETDDPAGDTAASAQRHRSSG